MNQNNSRLDQYIIESNYQMIILQHNKDPRIVITNPYHKLILAKAYHVNENYLKSQEILTQMNTKVTDKVLIFEINFLLLKSKYLSNTLLTQQEIQNIQKKILLCLDEQTIRYKIIKQEIGILKKNITKYQNYQYNIEIKQQKQFKQIHTQQDDYSLIMQGMPVFIIPQRWYKNWICYINKQTKIYPGYISQYEILDHYYQIYYDQSSNNQFTNQYLFHNSKYRIIPKKCWQYLYSKYGGNQIKRYNICSNQKYKQIVTQVYLKQIRIINKSQKKQKNNKNNSIISNINNNNNNNSKIFQNNSKLFENSKIIQNNSKIFQNNSKLFENNSIMVQITRKQDWSGLIKKLSLQWGKNGKIYQLSNNNNNNNKTPINIKNTEILENIDTTNKSYIYIQQSIIKKQKCGNPKCTEKQNLRYCQCKIIKYCGLNCLKQHRDLHYKRCESQLEYSKQKSVEIQNFNLKQRPIQGRKGLVGLRNLGNTCYMNSGLQCLSNTEEITKYFLSNDFLKDINDKNPLGTKGNLACAYAQLIRQIWTGNQPQINPFSIKKIIGKFASQFSSFGQQDSQEFISYLLDGLLEDLNLIKEKQNFEIDDTILSDQQGSLRSQINYSKRSQSYIRNLMVGQFKSTVICLYCNKKSICFDPFLLLSLPILNQNYTWQVYYLDLKNILPINFKFQFSIDMNIQKLKNKISKLLKIKQQQQYIQFQFISKQNLYFKQQNILNQNNILQYNKKYSNQYYLFCYLKYKTKLISILQFYYNQKHICYSRYIINQKNNFQLKKSIQNLLYQKYRYQQIIKNIHINSENNYSIISVHLYKKLEFLKFKQQHKISLFQQSSLNLQQCLENFTHNQLLQKQNQWYCTSCSKFKPAQKHMQIYKANKILVLSFKRFTRFRKICTKIQFPIQGLDMAPYILSNYSNSPILYDLYATVNHYGSLAGGHYTAYCQNFINKRWYQFNDSRVLAIQKAQIQSECAYLLFYRRRD